MLAGVTAWVLTDGKVGDEAQCLAVSEALGLQAEARHVDPRAPFSWAMPFGPIDPREAPKQPLSPIRPPFPDLLIASGRRAIAYVRHVKRASGGRTFTVILKDPRAGGTAADFIWVPEHDRLRGPNVLVTLTAPHRLTQPKLPHLVWRSWGRPASPCSWGATAAITASQRRTQRAFCRA